MYGQFDPKWLYIICVLGFEIGSAVCGAAPSMNALIIGRAIAGLGGAGMYLGVVMLLSIFTTQAERPAYFAMLGGTFGLGTVFALPSDRIPIS
jgi:MFS family permease